MVRIDSALTATCILAAVRPGYRVGPFKIPAAPPSPGVVNGPSEILRLLTADKKGASLSAPRENMIPFCII